MAIQEKEPIVCGKCGTTVGKFNKAIGTNTLIGKSDVDFEDKAVPDHATMSWSCEKCGELIAQLHGDPVKVGWRTTG